MAYRRQGSWLLFVLALLPCAHAMDKPKETVKPPPAAPAKAPQPPADEAFLEFLANWDSEDEDWNAFLAATVAKAAKAKPAEQATKKANEK